MPSPALSSGSNVLTGQLIRVVSMLGYALMITCIKYVTQNGVHLLEVLFLRSVFAIPIIFISCLFLSKQGIHALKPNSWKAQSIRIGLGVISMGLTFWTISLLPIAEATTLILMAPLFAPVFAFIVLSESISARQMTAIAIGLTGVVVVSGPALDGHISKLGIVVGISAAAVLACVTVTIRRFAKTESAWATTFLFTVCVSSFFACIYPWYAQAHSAQIWVMLVLTAVFGSVGQGLSALSFYYGSVSDLAFIDYTQIFWAVVIGFLVWSVIPPMTTWIGAALIIVSCLIAMKFR